MVVKLYTRRTFTEAEYWRIVYFRYNSIHSFDEIVRSYKEVAAITGIRYVTIVNFLKRFV